MSLTEKSSRHRKVIFETSCSPYVVLHVLHFHHTFIEGIPSKYFNNISTVISSFSLLLSKGYSIGLSKTLNIFLIPCIYCQILDDDHTHRL